MCRLLYARAEAPFDLPQQLTQFARVAEESKEFQGHGWGCSYLEDGQWKIYKNISPIWEDDLSQFGHSTLLLAHARSAFEGTEIIVENNMPFGDGQYVFIFNGELRGVKVKADGRIGAEKIFNFIKKFDRGDMLHALKKGTEIIAERTEYVKAMNIIIADKERAYVSSLFGEDPEYFTLRTKKNTMLRICSQPYPNETDWDSIANKTVQVF